MAGRFLTVPVNLKVFAPFCEKDRSMPTIPCEIMKNASCFNRAIGMDFATGGGLNKMVEILVVQLDLL